jgi:hypothetical protein
MKSVPNIEVLEEVIELAEPAFFGSDVDGEIVR